MYVCMYVLNNAEWKGMCKEGCELMRGGGGAMSV